MTFGRWVKPLDGLVAVLATSTSLVPDEHDREVLAEAAVILADPARVVTGAAGRPMVLIVNGHSVDPVVEAVDQLEQGLETAMDEIRTVLSNHDDLRRQLQKHVTDEAAG